MEKPQEGGWMKGEFTMNDHGMSLDAMSAFLEARLSRPLPGSAAHTSMFPLTAGGIRFKYITTMPQREGSVLILLYEDEGGLYFPLIKRPAYPGVHGGQVSLPGGKAEPGETPVETALREGEEEIGIVSHKVKVIGQMTGFNVAVSSIFITPVVGIYTERPEFRPDPREVERVLVFSVSKLQKQEEVLSREVRSNGSTPLIAPHFEIDEEIVWGATAMVMNEFRMVLRGD